MIATRFLRFASITAFIVPAVSTALLARAGAADMSAWDGDLRSAVRLLAATPADNTFRAGMEITACPRLENLLAVPR